MDVFDRNTKFTQWDNLAAMAHRSPEFDALRRTIADQIVDRLDFVKGRSFPLTACIGYGSNHVLQSMHQKQHLYGIKNLLLLDSCRPKVLRNELEFAHFEKEHGVRVSPVVADEEYLPLAPRSCDLIISSMALHWTNNLPGVLSQIKEALKPDGCFVGAFLGGSTLSELRSSFLIAEQEREGGVSPHTSPLAAIRDAGNVLTRSGFSLPTIDSIRFVNYYPDPFTLMHHLQLMGENNSLVSGRPATPRDTFYATAAAYQSLYGDPEGRGVPATFEVIFVIGWRPDPNQPKSARRGSGEVSMKQLAEQMNTTIKSITSKEESELTDEERKFLKDMEERNKAELELSTKSKQFSLKQQPPSENKNMETDHTKQIKEEQAKIAQEIIKKQKR